MNYRVTKPPSPKDMSIRPPEKKAALHGQPLFVVPLRGSNRIERANPGAGPAVLTFIRIYPTGVVLLDNRLYRTFAVTGTTVCTFVTDLICHINLSWY